LLCRRNGKLQELSEACSSDPMHGRTHHHFAGLQVQMTRLAPAKEEHTQPLVYFVEGLLINRSSRFFSSGVHVLLCDSRGRSLQIFSLTAIKSVLSFCKRRCSSISACAFRQAAGEGKDSATVLPSTLWVRRIWGSCPGS